VLAKLIGPRRDYKPEGGSVLLPNNLTLTLTGAGLLWFGWFGFNAGSAVAVETPVSGAVAGLAFTTTQSAAAAAALMWMIVERWKHGKATSVGMASGIVAGLVAITPAAGHVKPWAALIIGALSSIVCFVAVQQKARWKIDDSLDAFGVHGVGGILGALLVGVFCFTPNGGVLDGQWAQLGKQAVGVTVAVLYAGFGTLMLGAVIDKVVGLRAPARYERDGLDITVHGERGYHLEQA
jgi:Amt family ammonium transporter